MRTLICIILLFLLLSGMKCTYIHVPEPTMIYEQDHRIPLEITYPPCKLNDKNHCTWYPVVNN